MGVLFVKLMFIKPRKILFTVVQEYGLTSLWDFMWALSRFDRETRRGRLVDNRPSSDKLEHFVTWHVTCDKWHVTFDTWHVTCDMWHVTCFGGWTFSQNFSSLALTVSDLWYDEDLEEKAHLLTDLINQWQDEGCYISPVCVLQCFWTLLESGKKFVTLCALKGFSSCMWAQVNLKMIRPWKCFLTWETDKGFVPCVYFNVIL